MPPTRHGYGQNGSEPTLYLIPYTSVHLVSSTKVCNSILSLIALSSEGDGKRSDTWTDGRLGPRRKVFEEVQGSNKAYNTLCTAVVERSLGYYRDPAYSTSCLEYCLTYSTLTFLVSNLSSKRQRVQKKPLITIPTHVRPTTTSQSDHYFCVIF